MVLFSQNMTGEKDEKNWIDLKTQIEAFVNSCKLIKGESIRHHNISLETSVSPKDFMSEAKRYQAKVIFTNGNGKDDKEKKREEWQYYCVIGKENLLLTTHSETKLHEPPKE